MEISEKGETSSLKRGKRSAQNPNHINAETHAASDSDADVSTCFRCLTHGPFYFSTISISINYRTIIN